MDRDIKSEKIRCPSNFVPNTLHNPILSSSLHRAEDRKVGEEVSKGRLVEALSSTIRSPFCYSWASDTPTHYPGSVSITLTPASRQSWHDHRSLVTGDPCEAPLCAHQMTPLSLSSVNALSIFKYVYSLGISSARITNV